MKIFKYLIWLFAFAMAIVGCKKDTYNLSERLDKSQVKFEVVQDLETDPGGNTVILINKTPQTIAMWDYGTGKSNRDRDTIRFAFAGDYVIKFSAETGGGVVEMDPVTVKVTADNLSYVDDPLWNFLTGGVGQEKTWILDYGDHGIFDGPVSYYEPLTNWQQMQDGTAKLGWAPAWKDNQWIIQEADKASTMTFSLKGGPFMKTHKVTENVDESGTYFLDSDGKTITTSGATILRSQSFIANATNWNNKLVILSLTENQLQIGVRRTNSEGDYLYSWNFISKEYADNYVPPDTGPKLPDAGFDPKFEAGELLTMLTGTSGQTWGIDGKGNAIDWIAKGNGWTKSSNDSRDWGWNASWDAVADNSWIRFEKNGMKYFRNQSGVVTTGTFSINEATNEVTLNGELLIQNPGNWMSPAVATFKVVKAFPGEADTKGIWFGTSYDVPKDEWFAFHYIIQ
ncbi:MAG: hypothetical protein EOP46_01235 [Sphingobacteriaceae bacterium]|nr:MAG: hypothetical protein EOP46_01235 [Sphingobacteriaceae bacterium]